MEAKGVFHVVKNALLPSPKDERAVRMFAAGALQLGDKVFITVHRARNPEFNAKAHIVFRKIGEAIGQSEDVIKLWLKWETGRVDLVRLPTGKHIPNPRSFAFESMGEDEFQAFWRMRWK